MTKYLLLIFLIFSGIETFCSGNSKYRSYQKIRILSQGKSSKQQIYKFIRNRNKEINKYYLLKLIDLYLKESQIEFINHDVAIAQMCLETNFLQFTGVVKKGANNFAGIGAINQYNRGDKFPSSKIGIRAHIQHLKAYSSILKPIHNIVDPRFNLVKKGSCTYIQDLTGKWAIDKAYGNKIIYLVKQLIRF
jgi:hypothetical protein